MRTFIAIEVSDEVKKAAGEFVAELKKQRANISWVKKENVHITLKFLGEIDERKILLIEDVLKSCAEKKKPFEIEIKDCGGFPNLHKPRVIWIGITEGSQELKDIANCIDSKLSNLGFEKETRAFKPH